MKLDIKHSTIEIGGRTFPACALLLPDVEGDPTPERERVLGGNEGDGFYVYLPTESGALINIGLSVGRRNMRPACHHRDYCVDVWLYSRSCCDMQMWLPELLGIHPNGTLDRVGAARRMPCHWHDPDEDWLVEHIDRLAAREVRMLPGPKVGLLRLDDPLLSKETPCPST